MKNKEFDEWFEDLTKVFKENDMLYLLNTEDKESYLDYWEDGDPVEEVFNTELSSATP